MLFKKYCLQKNAIIILLSISCSLVFAQKKVNFLIFSKNDSVLKDTSNFEKYTNQTLEKTKNYWLKFSLSNPNAFDNTYILYSTSKWGEAEIFHPSNYANNTSERVNSVSGSLLPLHARSYARSITAFKIILEKHKTQTFYLHLKGNLSIYTPKVIDFKISTLEDYEQQDQKRFWLQAIFVGIIIIMALYNFVIYLSVHDVSYLYYVISILGIGLYFFFYYGFGIELLWQNSPQWDTFSFAFIVPITNLARIYFTKSYLHLSETSPLLDKSLNIFSAFCLFIFLLATGCYFANIDFLDLLVDLIGFIGTTVLSMMFLCGIMVWQKGYRPARYFTLANLVLVLGGILFIIRELGWIQDSSLTRYAVQYGVIAQVVLFSLGLSSRLNQAQVKVAQLELEKERERKQFLEEQSELLKQKVAEQTKDLVLLDIDLAGKMTGIDIAENLKLQGIPFIFLTAMADIQTIEKAKQTEPYAYLVKPVRAENLLSTIEVSLYNYNKLKNVSEVTHNQEVTINSFGINDSIFVKYKRRLEKIKIADILWIEAEDIYAIIITKTGKFILSQPLKNIEERLPTDHFMRVHRSHIVQLDKIQAIEENDLIIEGKHIAIGKTFKDRLMAKLAFL